MTTLYEAEVIIGIEDIALAELQTLKGIEPHSLHIIRDGFIRFIYDGQLFHLNKLHSIIAVYAILSFDIPRPKALLGHQNFTMLTTHITNIMAQWNAPADTLGIGAAGSDSSVMQRIKHELCQTLGLSIADTDKGDVYLRIIPAHKNQGWDVLIRLTSRPLATREWRVHNVPGALNATVAYAMTQLADFCDDRPIANLCSGTATILIEHALTKPDDMLIAVDNDRLMLESANNNIQAIMPKNTILQIYGDAQQTPLSSDSIGGIYADLPFGHHIGSHDENEWLYPAILAESARITHPDGSCIIITHEIQLMEQSVSVSPWKIAQRRKINLSGLHPQIFVLERV